MHPNAELLQRLFAAFAARDLATIDAALAPEVTWTTPGRNLLAGTYEGRDAVLAQLARSGELTGGTYATEVRDVLASDAHVAVLYTGTGTRGETTAALDVLALYAIAGGRVTSVRVAPLDPVAFDAFWSQEKT